MAVLLREKVKVGGEELEVRVFRPSGSLSRANRERAEQLDDFLALQAPRIVESVMHFPKDKALQKWYRFGEELHGILDDNQLVSPADLRSGLLWEALKQHLPSKIGLKGAGEAHLANGKCDGQRGHFPECYAVAKHPWADVKWLRRWTDWTDIYHRESLSKDVRVLRQMREEVAKLDQYPSKRFLAEVLRSLTVQTAGKELCFLDDAAIARIVRRAFERAEQATTQA